MTNGFSSRSNAKRAAHKALGGDTVENEDFKVIPAADGRWGWTSLKDSSGDSPGATPRPRRHPRAKGKVRASESGKGGARKDTKQAELIAMLRTADGATVDEIATTFGWQKHTVRGAIAGALKKKLGLAVTSEKIEGRGRVYKIAG